MNIRTHTHTRKRKHIHSTHILSSLRISREGNGSCCCLAICHRVFHTHTHLTRWTAHTLDTVHTHMHTHDTHDTHHTPPDKATHNDSRYCPTLCFTSVFHVFSTLTFRNNIRLLETVGRMSALSLTTPPPQAPPSFLIFWGAGGAHVP